MANSDKKAPDKDVRGLQSALKSLRDKNDKVKPVDVEREKDVGQTTEHRNPEDEANLLVEIQVKKREIQPCHQSIDKFSQVIKKLSQQNKDDERRIDDEEQGEDENVKLLTKRKEEKERREIKNQKEINNSLF
jgi:uncharacterized protein YoxC